MGSYLLVTTSICNICTAKMCDMQIIKIHNEGPF